MVQIGVAIITSIMFGIIYALWNLFVKYVINKEKYVHNIAYEKSYIYDGRVKAACFKAWVKENEEKYFYRHVCTSIVLDDEFLQRIIADLPTDLPIRFNSEEQEDNEYYAEYKDGIITRSSK